MRRFFIAPDQIGQNQPRLEGQDARHIGTVLRLPPGDQIVLFDGSGAEYKARIVAISNDHVQVALLEQLMTSAESALELVLAQGYLKEKKMDLLVRQLTELGVSRWLPFMAHRSVPAPDERRLQARRDRWQKISQEAVKQCCRTRPMIIDPVVSFQEALQLSDPYGLKLIFWEKENQVLLSGLKHPINSSAVFVMIGPEGGFEKTEIAAAQQKGFDTLGLGPRILRAETATIAVCALLQFVFGDMG